MTTKNVTNGELRTYKECKRKWWLGWHRKLRPIRAEGPSAAALGSLVHLGLQVQYDPNDQRNPYEVVIAKITEDMEAVMSQTGDVDTAAEIRKQGELAIIMLEGYFEWLQETGNDQGLTVVAAETKIIAPFPAIPGVNLMGKLDLRLHRELDGARLFLDHKTVGSFAAAMKGLVQDEQLMHYHLLEYLDALAQFGEEQAAAQTLTAGALYNMLRKVKRTAQSKPPYYDRIEVTHNQNQLRSYYLRVYGEVLDIMKTAERLDAGEPHGMVAYPNPTKDCSWKCPFVGVCPIFDEHPEAAEQFVTEWFEVGDPLDRYDDNDYTEIH